MEIVVNTLAESYEAVIYDLLWKHIDVTTEDGEKTWQGSPMTIVVTNPCSSDYIHKNSPYGKQFYEQYVSAIVYGYADSDSKFEYDYHSRLFDYSSWIENDDVQWTNQIQYIIDKLKDQKSTRRAIGITWDPVVDTTKKDVPCLQFVQFWNEKDRLNMLVLFRSEDMLMGYPQNVYGLTQLLSYVSHQIGVQVGKYYHMVTIPHLYNVRDKNYLDPWLK